MKGYQAAALANDEQTFNTTMSTVRQTVEWRFGDILSQWAFVDFRKRRKIRLQPVAVYYKVAALLMNCRTISRGGNKTSKFFSLTPPTLDEYLA